MGLGKKAKREAKAVKGKTKKDAGKVKHKGQSQECREALTGLSQLYTGPGSGWRGQSRTARPELTYEKGPARRRADVGMDAPASAAKLSGFRSADTTAGRPESALRNSSRVGQPDDSAAR